MNQTSKTIVGAALLLLSTLISPLSASAQGTAFTYQGFLTSQGAPANGAFDLQFSVFDAVSGGAQQGVTVQSNAFNITNGLFTVTLDPGANVFSGAARWLNIGVRPAGSASFTNVVPRQPITAAPYAIYAGGVSAAGISGTIPASALSGAYSGVVNLSNVNNSFAGNGAGLTNLNSASLGGIAASNHWRLTGNNVSSNQFLGSTNNVNLELRANNEPAMRFSYRSNATYGVSPAVIGGYKGNSASFNLFVNTDYVGATIGGGGYSNAANFVFADLGTVSGGAGNIASGVGAFVGGGTNNIASGDWSAVLGGAGNRATDFAATAMGYKTTASGISSTAMGSFSTASGNYSTATGSSTASGNYSTALGDSIASGFHSTAMGTSEATDEASTAMGIACLASGPGAVAAGWATEASGSGSAAMGSAAKAIHDGSFVWSDQHGGAFSNFYSAAVDSFNIRARGGVWLDDDASFPTDIFFGSNTRQMLNLWGTSHGIGVQSSTTYFRSSSRFSWFRNGAHSDTENSPGTGGSVLMTLNNAGLTVNGTFVSASDRNKKENFAPVNPVDVLAKVVALPISQWNYKDDEERSAHVGPMAQDFKAAFNLGADDKHIATVDADGVALAAIQGLNQKLEATRAENAELKRELAEIKRLLLKR